MSRHGGIAKIADLVGFDMKAADVSGTVGDLGEDGGAERDRTADLLIANEALSQLSYGPAKARGLRPLRNLQRVAVIYGPGFAESRIAPHPARDRAQNQV